MRYRAYFMGLVFIFLAGAINLLLFLHNPFLLTGADSLNISLQFNSTGDQIVDVSDCCDSMNPIVRLNMEDVAEHFSL